jgi:putative ABC transport system permease protein
VLNDLLLRLRALLRRTAVNREIDEELRFHVERQIESYKKGGLDEAEASRRARLEFGGVDQIKEEFRDALGVRILDDLWRDLFHAARLLRRNPGFTTIIVATLAIAIGATVTVFSIADAWLFKPLNFPEPEQLVIGFAARPERPTEPAVWLPYRAYLGWKERWRRCCTACDRVTSYRLSPQAWH